MLNAGSNDIMTRGSFNLPGDVLASSESIAIARNLHNFKLSTLFEELTYLSYLRCMLSRAGEGITVTRSVVLCIEKNGIVLVSYNEEYDKILNGAGLTLVLSGTGKKLDVHELWDMPANSVSIFLQIPQYVLITLGEVLFSVSGLEFAYQQAPLSMKSFLSACWQLTTAFGNLIIIIIIAEIRIPNQVPSSAGSAGPLLLL